MPHPIGGEDELGVGSWRVTLVFERLRHHLEGPFHIIKHTALLGIPEPLLPSNHNVGTLPANIVFISS